MASINTVRIGTTDYAIVPTISIFNTGTADGVIYGINETTISGTQLLKSTSLNTSGSITASTLTASTITATSDRRLKENIRAASKEDLIKGFDSLNLHYFNFISDKNKTTQVGLIAQELREELPEILKNCFIHLDEKTGYFGISESKLVYLCIEKIHQLEEEIKQLKK